MLAGAGIVPVLAEHQIIVHPDYPPGTGDNEAQENYDSDTVEQGWYIDFSGLTEYQMNWINGYNQRLYAAWNTQDGGTVFVSGRWMGGYYAYYGGNASAKAIASCGSGSFWTDTRVYTSADGSTYSTNLMWSITGNTTYTKETQSKGWRYMPAWYTMSPCCHYLTAYIPPWKYDCYYAVEGVAFFDGMTNHNFTLKLSSPDSMWAPEWFSVYGSGSYHVQSVLHHLEMPDNGKKIEKYKWELFGLGKTNLLGSWETDPAKPDEYVYTITVDWTELNTNAPPVPPPAPTNQPPVPPDPTNQPPVTNYPPPPDPPVPTNNPPYPPYPPYPPWTNNPPPPQPPGPDTNTPPIPNPNPDPGQTGGPSYDTLYSAMRHALRDEGNAYDGAMPGDYPIDGAASGLMMQVAGYCSNLSRSAVQSASNTDLILGRGYAILTGASGMLRDALPTSIGRIDSWSLPWFNNSAGITINLSQPPFALFISTFRSFIKWMMYLSAFWMIFRLLRRTFGRSE